VPNLALAPDLSPTFGQLLRAARYEAGLTQAELAIASGVERPAVGQWEADRTLVRADRQPLVEDALHLEPGTLGAWVRYSPIYLATLPDVPGGDAIPGQFRRLSLVSQAA
jgi:transcriptional regulator with XRE-family HTH domain